MSVFTSNAFGFSISYPDDWQALPAPWIKTYQRRAASTSIKLAESLEMSRAPFLVVHDPNVPDGLAIPTIRCQVFDYASITAAGGVSGMLHTLDSSLREAFPDYEAIEHVSEYVVAGVIGAKLVSAMSVSNAQGEWYHAESELLCLPASRHVFLVGLSATSDSEFRPIQEFADAVRSIRVS